MNDGLAELVRVRLLRLMEARRVDYATVAQRLGYKSRTIAAFCTRERDVVSKQVAAAALHVYPELGQGIICPTCGEVSDAWKSDDQPDIKPPDDRIDRLQEIINQALAFVRDDEVKANIREGVAAILAER